MMTTPRVFIVRHGETEWSLNGRHTGTTDIPLTANGERRIKATGHALVGDDRLIVPAHLAHVYVSPRYRARRTVELLDLGCKVPLPWSKDGKVAESSHKRSTEATVTVSEDIREWDYGEYEGMITSDIKARRKEQGLGDWSIWRDGCPGGESPQQITERVDRIIKEIRDTHQAHAIGKPVGSTKPYDVLVVAHGHILRCFAARWIGKAIDSNPNMILEAGGVGTLSYEHHNITEPAILLGGAFMADVVEQVEEK